MPTTATIDQTVSAFERLCKQNGLPPTSAELARELGLKSTSTVHFRLKDAVAAGRLQKRPGRGQSRNFALVGVCPCCGRG